MNIKDEKKLQLEEFANITSEIQKIINETQESFDEKDYERSKELIERHEEARKELQQLMKKQRKYEEEISLANRKKENYPLVPIEDINPDIPSFLKEIEEIDNFYNSVEECGFFESYKELEKKVNEYKQKEEEKERKQAEKEMEEELKNFLKGNPEYKGKGAKLIERVPYLNDKEKVEYMEFERFLSGGFYELYKRFGYMDLPLFSKKTVWVMEDGGDYHMHGPERVPCTTNFSFVPYEKCTIEEKQRCKEIEAKLEEIKNSPEEKYDEPAEISLKLVDKKSNKYFTKEVHLTVTQRELANAGIVPGYIKGEWFDDKSISAQEIAQVDKNEALTTTEVGGVKGFIKKLLDKFKGKGEK